MQDSTEESPDGVRIRSQSASKRTSEIMTDTLLIQKYEEVVQDPLPTSPTFLRRRTRTEAGAAAAAATKPRSRKRLSPPLPWTPMVKLSRVCHRLCRRRRATSRILAARRWMLSKLKRPRKSRSAHGRWGEARWIRIPQGVQAAFSETFEMPAQKWRGTALLAWTSSTKL